MPFKEIRKTKDCLILNRYDKEGFLLIPALFRQHFSGTVKILFDPKENLLALQPSEDKNDYPTSNWRIWCTSFFKEYNVRSQKVLAIWDADKKYLLAKIERD